MNIFRGLQFYIKNKLKSEIFKGQKIENGFLCHKYGFKLGNLTKNLVTFKRRDEVKDEKF